MSQLKGVIDKKEERHI